MNIVEIASTNINTRQTRRRELTRIDRMSMYHSQASRDEEEYAVSEFKRWV
jgi:hypothetical protein